MRHTGHFHPPSGETQPHDPPKGRRTPFFLHPSVSLPRTCSIQEQVRSTRLPGLLPTARAGLRAPACAPPRRPAPPPAGVTRQRLTGSRVAQFALAGPFTLHLIRYAMRCPAPGIRTGPRRGWHGPHPSTSGGVGPLPPRRVSALSAQPPLSLAPCPPASPPPGSSPVPCARPSSVHAGVPRSLLYRAGLPTRRAAPPRRGRRHEGHRLRPFPPRPLARTACRYPCGLSTGPGRIPRGFPAGGVRGFTHRSAVPRDARATRPPHPPDRSTKLNPHPARKT